MRVAYGAVDLGAGSGRVIRVEVSPQSISTTECRRFVNEPITTATGLHWNSRVLFNEVRAGLRHLAAVDPEVRSVGIDTWGADYGLLGDGELLELPFCYRDPRTVEAQAEVHAAITPADLYARNGLQALPFNTVYQLVADRQSGLLERADRLLFTPDLIGYWLTGQIGTERTIASTSGLLDANSGEWSSSIIGELGLPPEILPPLKSAGDELGLLDPSAGAFTRPTPVRMVASHDTASAVVATPLRETGSVYISCGTWALTGTELERPVLTEAARKAGFTNERGVDDRVRFQTNVMGLGILTAVLRDWSSEGQHVSIEEALAMAQAVTLPAAAVFDVEDPVFLRAGGERRAIQEWFTSRGRPAPHGLAALVRCVLESLAESFARSVRSLADLGGIQPTTIHLVGGGARNRLLCQLTADRAGLPVLAGPVEAAAIGNALLQYRLDRGEHDSLPALRRRVESSSPPTLYRPSLGQRSGKM